MATTLEISCASCGSLYRATVQHPNVTLLFQCMKCNDHNLYHVGRVVLLNEQVMLREDEDTRKKHVLQRIEDCVLDALAEAGERLERLININVNVKFAKRVNLEALKGSDTQAQALGKGEESDIEEHADHDSAFARIDEEAPISDDEIADFMDTLNSPEFWDRLASS